MILKVKKDVVVFKQRFFFCEVIYCSWHSYTRSNVLPLQMKTRLLCRCFVNSGSDFLSRPILSRNRREFKGKKESNHFRINCTCQQVNITKNTADETTLTSIVAAVDSICKKRQKGKNFPAFTVSWQKRVKLCVSSQKGELFKISTFSFQSLMLKLTKKN